MSIFGQTDHDMHQKSSLIVDDQWHVHAVLCAEKGCVTWLHNA